MIKIVSNLSCNYLLSGVELIENWLLAETKGPRPFGVEKKLRSDSPPSIVAMLHDDDAVAACNSMQMNHAQAGRA